MLQARVSKALAASIVAIVAMVALWGALFAVQPAYADELEAGDVALTDQSIAPDLVVVASASSVKIDKSITITAKNSIADQTGTWTWTVNNSNAKLTKISDTKYKLTGVTDGNVNVTVKFKTDTYGMTGTATTTVKVIGVKKASKIIAGNFKYQRNGVDTVKLIGKKKKDLGKTSLTVPNTVKIYDKKGFAATYKVTTVAAKAIRYQSKVTKITVSNNVQTIGNHAFCSNPKLKTLVLGTGVKKIGQVIVHYKTNSLKTVIIKSTKLTPANVKNCFKGNKSITTVKVPASKLKYYKTKVFTKANCGKKVTVTS